MIEIIGSELNQWDIDRSVKVTGIVASHVHLANQGDSSAAVKELSGDQVQIPCYLLQTGKQLCVYAVLNGVTIERKVFSVRKRERPADYVYADEQRNFIYALITDAQEATEAANQVAQDLRDAKDRGDFNGPPGEQGPKGDKGDPGSALIDDSTVREDAAWSSLNTIDKLCPSFTKTGTLVQCEPVEGYPLTITAREVPGTLSVTVCGKNLYDSTTYPLTDGYYINNINGIHSGLGEHETYCATLDYIPVEHLRGRYITLNYTPGGNTPGMMFYDSDKNRIQGSGGKGNNILVPNDACYMRFSSTIVDKDKVQIELGSISTGYEKFVIYASGALVDSEDVVKLTAGHGINTVFAVDQVLPTGPAEIVVTGKADPVAIINKLTNAVSAL